MEAIKCPNCGSEKIKELTEEKYYCLSCDNMFLVHNLSKEFRMTDEHIENMHKELNKKLDNIQITAGGNNYKELLFDAERLLKDGSYIEAYDSFKKYSAMVPNSCEGYLGMYKCITFDFGKDSELHNVSGEENLSDFGSIDRQGFDVLRKAYECDDCNKEELLEKVTAFYKRTEHVDILKFFEARKECCTNLSYIEDFDGFASRFFDNITGTVDLNSIKDIVYKEYELEEIKHNKNDKNIFKKIFGSTGMMNVLKLGGITIGAWILETVILTSIMISYGEGGISISIPPILRVVELLLYIVLEFTYRTAIPLFLLWIITPIIIVKISKNVTSKFENNNSIYLEISDLKSYVDGFEEVIDRINSTTPQDVKNELFSNIDKDIPADVAYDRFVNAARLREEERVLEAQRLAEQQEGYYMVKIVSWGSGASLVRDIAKQYLSVPSAINSSYKARTEFTIHSMRKSDAYELQRTLMDIGAVVYVSQM